MRKFAGIIESIMAPPDNCLWIKNGEIRYLFNGRWRPLIGISQGDEDRQELEEKVDSLDKEMGTAQNNITKLKNGKLTVIPLEIGDSVTVKQHNLINLTGIAGFFFTELDYGYGVGTYQPSIGGFAHVVTAHDNNTYYNIAADGSITKNDSYISPNEPYTVNLTSEQINVTLDDIIANKVSKCGEITVTGSTGSITYTRTSDSTPSAIYFISDRKDGKVTLLTYIISTKTINSAVVNPPLPMASILQAGTVKMAPSVTNLAVDSATTETIASKINDLLAALRTAGILSTN